MKILITGAAGFIGYHTAIKFLENPENEVVGMDNLNDYYDVQLKEDRLKFLKKIKNFEFANTSLENSHVMNYLFGKYQFDLVINLAAQAGVRYSIENPMSYIKSNIVGFQTLLEACRTHPPKHLVYSSSSSVYGMNSKQPFSTEDKTDSPVSLYAATKKSNEVVAHAYSHLYEIPMTGLRFFTVYGPWGRPDMAPMLFADAISKGEPIKVFNNGEMERDFTYIDDIVEGIFRISKVIPEGCELYNIGNGSPVQLMYFIQIMESELGIEAKKNFMPMQDGDVKSTYADTVKLEQAIQYTPQIGIKEGVKKFIEWYKNYYK